jgi:hypothetical protein
MKTRPEHASEFDALLKQGLRLREEPQRPAFVQKVLRQVQIEQIRLVLAQQRRSEVMELLAYMALAIVVGGLWASMSPSPLWPWTTVDLGGLFQEAASCVSTWIVPATLWLLAAAAAAAVLWLLLDQRALES